MGIRKYRSDKIGTKDINGAIPWYQIGMGNPVLAVVYNLETPTGKRLVYMLGLEKGGLIRAAYRFEGKDMSGRVSFTNNAFKFIPKQKS